MNCATTRSLQARYRPAVRAAWIAHCYNIGADHTNRAAQDVWYRNFLQERAGISTTAGASAAQLETLIEAFLSLAGTPSATTPQPDCAGIAIPPVDAFSPAQNKVFADLVRKAWRRVQECDPETDFHAWFEIRMRDAALGPRWQGNLFDRAMCLFGVIAQDDFWIRRSAEATERRMRHVIRAKLAELGRLTQRELDWSYVQGIHEQAKLQPSLDDCPAETLRSLLHMLGSAIARERRKQGISAAR